MNDQSKSQPVSREMVMKAFERVRDNRGSSGVDKVSLNNYEDKLEGKLYKLWNRMSSGSYFPSAVKEVLINKQDGSKRTLGIPTVEDRIAQTVVKQELEPLLEPIFHPNSFGYRPGRSAHDAVSQAEANCRKHDWVVDLDIRRFFDMLSHKHLLRIVRLYTEENWILMYIERWLEAPLAKRDGSLEARVQGTPQGGVISPLLANLYLHHAFDTWMDENFPLLPFERYADDIIIHCRSRKQAEYVLDRVRERLQKCKLELHPEKCKIVYCKDSNRKSKHPLVSFDFLGFTFKPRKAKGPHGTFTGYGAGISAKSRKRFYAKIREMSIPNRTGSDIWDLARLLNNYLRGFHNYYCKFREWELVNLYWGVNTRLFKWARHKYKRTRKSTLRSKKLLEKVYQSEPDLFYHWRYNPPRLAARAV